MMLAMIDINSPDNFLCVVGHADISNVWRQSWSTVVSFFSCVCYSLRNEVTQKAVIVVASGIAGCLYDLIEFAPCLCTEMCTLRRIGVLWRTSCWCCAPWRPGDPSNYLAGDQQTTSRTFGTTIPLSPWGPASLSIIRWDVGLFFFFVFAYALCFPAATRTHWSFPFISHDEQTKLTMFSDAYSALMRTLVPRKVLG